MLFRLVPIPLFMTTCVSSLVVMEDDEDCNIPLFANGYPSLIFVAGSATTCLNDTETVSPLFLFGHSRKPAILSVKGPFTLITWFLYPHILSIFMGDEARLLTDNYLDLDLTQPAGRLLKDQLLNTSVLQFRLQLVDSFITDLAASVKPIGPQQNIIAWATNTMRKTNGQISINNMLQDLSITERSLQRLFESQVGVSPRLYSRICQFDAAFQQLNGGRFNKLSDIAYGNGFADQSHLIRTFKEFTGFTPKAYLNAAEPYRN